jgi:hypothetical protein
MGPWTVFAWIASHWQLNEEAWPAQVTLGVLAGCDERTVRTHIDVLEASGAVSKRYERQRDGSQRIYYAPGPATLEALETFVERYPKPSAAPTEAADLASAAPPAAASGGLPDPGSGELRDPDLREHSSSSRAPRAREPQAGEEEQPEVTREDREIARLALQERMRRKDPTRPPPRWFDASDVAMVAACTATIEGDREQKLRVHRDAIAGAFRSSKTGPPAARFIWGRLEHFREHVERGRRMAEADARAKVREASATSLRRDGRTSQAGALAAPTLSVEQMLAGTERLFGRRRRISNG